MRMSFSLFSLLETYAAQRFSHELEELTFADESPIR
jgi:hypothetical protein